MITAFILAVLNILSVFAQQKGDTTAIANASDSLQNYKADSSRVYKYINQSKNCINKNPDSSLMLADLAVKLASKINDGIIIGDAAEQRKLVQDANVARLKKQNDAFEAQYDTNDNSYILPLILGLILLIACSWFFVFFKRKNNIIQELEDSNLRIEYKNKELIQFQKQLVEKNAELELIQSQPPPPSSAETLNVSTLKDSLIPMLAHDIRSPLASLQHMLTLTRENVLNPEEFQKLSVALEADIYNLRGILDNMLLWTREQMIEVKINKSSFDVSEALQSVILMHRNNLISKNITVKNYLYPQLNVYSDKDIITAVLRNIFSNAVKFTEENKNIYITQVYFNKKVFISVKDEGRGITDEILEKINKGEHVTTKGTSNEKGTGIGLMFTKDLLKKIDETFDITTVPGGGTSATFSVSINE